MQDKVSELAAIAAEIAGKPLGEINAGQVCNSKRVSDHHAIVPTKTAATGIDISDLPTGERNILLLVARSLLRAVCPPYRYAETAVTVDCGGHSFTAKGKEVLDPGWRTYAENKADTVLPDGLTEGAALSVDAVRVQTGQTAPAKHFTEDTLLQSMESAGVEEMPEDVENGAPTQAQRSGLRGEKEGQRNGADARRKAGAAECSLSRRGIGTPATRASILEKLVSAGFVERRKAKKITSLIPTQEGNSLITVLPEMLQSPLLTAEWENRLKQVERGELAPEDFMEAITAMVRELAATCVPVPGGEALFPSGKESIGPCPRCNGNVSESKKGFFCENPSCRFALWKDNRFFAAKKKDFDRTAAAALLNEGKLHLTGCWSEKTHKTYDATVYLEDNGEKTNYRLVFDRNANG